MKARKAIKRKKTNSKEIKEKKSEDQSEGFEVKTRGKTKEEAGP